MTGKKLNIKFAQAPNLVGTPWSHQNQLQFLQDFLRIFTEVLPLQLIAEAFLKTPLQRNWSQNSLVCIRGGLN